MEMKAIDDHYGVADSVVRAAVAGIDIILFSHTAAKQASAYDHLLAAVERGAVPLSGRARLVEFSPALDTIAQEATDDSSLSYYVGQTLPNVELHLLPATPSEADLAGLMTQPTETLVIATRNAHLIPAQRDAVTTQAARWPPAGRPQTA